MKQRYRKSNQTFKKVKEIIPLASQTFSKSYYQYVQGSAPLFINRGKGCHVWDIDGNEYIDMVSGLLSVSLGYQYKAVDNAIKKQLKNGISFSLPSTLEADLAKLIIKHIPCAEMVRFGKNGSDVTSGAIRVARAVTGKDHVAVCGYHGWHDWYIGSTKKNLGVPHSTRKMTHSFTYNDIGSLEKIFKQNKGKVGAVIMEPINYTFPQNNFLQKVKTLAHKNGALFIFDEIITGWRLSLGGAQKYFNVIPDLATFGKSMANGMPISVLVGKKKYMKKLEDIFYSFTFGGETLSLVAAIATIKEMEKKKVPQVLAKKGAYTRTRLNRLIQQYNLSDLIEIKGADHWQIFSIKDKGGFSSFEIKTYIQQELLARGVLWYGQHNFNFSHTTRDLNKVLAAYDEVLLLLSQELKNKTLRKNLQGKPIIDLFRVR